VPHPADVTEVDLMSSVGVASIPER
jgi:hypothetical protein